MLTELLCAYIASHTLHNHSGTFPCGQVNKNWLAKVLVGTDAAVAALAFKAWWQPSFTLAANAGAQEVHV